MHRWDHLSQQDVGERPRNDPERNLRTPGSSLSDPLYFNDPSLPLIKVKVVENKAASTLSTLSIVLTRHLRVYLPHRDQHVVGPREHVPRFGEPVLQGTRVRVRGLLPLLSQRRIEPQPQWREIIEGFLRAYSRSERLLRLGSGRSGCSFWVML